MEIPTLEDLRKRLEALAPTHGTLATCPVCGKRDALELGEARCGRATIQATCGCTLDKIYHYLDVTPACQDCGGLDWKSQGA